MFVRPSLIASTNFKTTLNEVDNYIKQFDAKMKPYIDYKERLDLQTAQKLGKTPLVCLRVSGCVGCCTYIW